MLEKLAWEKLVQAGEWEHGLNWFNLRSGIPTELGYRSASSFLDDHKATRSATRRATG
jgi:hypothetical protein